jgi:hypothetical protein
MHRLRASAAAFLVGLIVLPAVIGAEDSDGPQLTSDGQMRMPANYREWVFLSSGLGMTYGPLGSAAGHDDPMFDNVFVNRSAYRSFLESGKWPDKTVLVLEVRGSQSKGSINHGGRFQTGPMGVEVHVKDARLPGKWAFFSFDNGNTTAKPIPSSESCYSCHQASGAVDTTFVQFYPTLLDVAREKHTLSKSY